MTDPSRRTSTMVPVLPGIVYFALVFALGFVLGTLRTIFVRDAPGVGRLIGVLIELPIMLWASWFLCRLVIRRFAVASTAPARGLMGGLAFALLMIAELLVSTLLSSRTAGEHFALYKDASHAAGLVAQIAFAVMPLLQLRERMDHQSGNEFPSSRSIRNR